MSKTDAIKAYVKAFCTGDQAASDAAARYIAEDVDLRFGILVGVDQEQVGYAPKGFDALFRRARRNRAFHLGNKRSLRGHRSLAVPASTICN